jgi:hypothetical protein
MLAKVERVVPWLALAATPLALLLVLRSQGDAIAALDSVGWAAIGPSCLALVLPPLLQGVTFCIVLRLLTRQTRFLDAMVVWSRSYVIRYVPTGTLAVAYRVSARRKLGASAEQVLAAFTYEHFAVLAAAAAACLGFFALSGDLPPILPLGIALVTLVLTVALTPRFAGRGVGAIARRAGIRLSVLVDGRQLATVVAVNLLGWLGTGAAVFLLVTAVTGSSPPFLWLVGSYTAGYLVGFVAPLSPGGLGVREGMLVVLLAPHYGVGVALAVSLLIRLANIAGDLLAVALVHGAWALRALYRRVRRRLAVDIACAGALALGRRGVEEELAAP